jgi:ferrous iron transport protein A
MVLADVDAGKNVKILHFNNGKGLEGKLRQMGIYTGAILLVVRRAPFHGPVLLEFEGREIALGYGIAKKILVEGVE